MQGDSQRDIFKLLREAQDKYTYFLLTASGAAIALAVNQTAGARIAWSQVPLAGAVFCWGLSFFFGCRNLLYVCSTLYANHNLFVVQSGRHPDVPPIPDYIAAASEGIRNAIEKNADSANLFAKLQFRLFVSGGVAFVAWHILEMFLRTFPGMR